MPAGAIVADALLPGSGLLARGRLGVGVALIAAGALAASALALGLAGVPGFDGGLVRAAAAYLALGAAAALGGWSLDRGSRIDPTAVRAAHDEAAAAFLRGENPAALAAARRVARLAPQEPGAWDLLALVARAAGDPGTADRAERRARALERRAATV
jgi:hypothetical protein